MWIGNLLGYKKINNEISIIPEEASTVREAAILFLEGMTFYSIKEQFIREGRLTKRGTTNWTVEKIQRMLTNEKYTGNALMGKTYCPDYLTKKRVKNNGESDQYYIEGGMPCILPQEIFDMIVEEIELRKVFSNEHSSKDQSEERNNVYSSKYALSNILVCGECGSLYRRCTWTARGKVRYVWRCGERKRTGTKICKNLPTILESDLHATLLKVLNNLIKDHDHAESESVNNLITEKNEVEEKLRDISRKGMEYQRIKNELVEQLLDKGISLNDYDLNQEKINEAQKRVEDCFADFNLLRMEKARVDCLIRRSQQLEDLLTGLNYQLDEYDDGLIRKIINRILISNSNELEITFKIGFKSQTVIDRSLM